MTTDNDFDQQVADIQIRPTIQNGFTGLSIPRAQAVG